MNLDAIKPLPEETPDLTLDASLAPESEASLTLDGEIDIPLPPFSPKNRKAYFSKLRFLASIHRQNTAKLNSLRQAQLEVMFREEDKYIPEDESTCNLLGLYFDSIPRQA